MGGITVLEINGRNLTLLKNSVIRVSLSIPEMVRVEGGRFIMGNYPGNTLQVSVSDFAIGKYPVTNAEYNGFLCAIGKERNIRDKNHLFLGDNQPVVNVSWEDAMGYCDFLNSLKLPRKDVTGLRRFSLPTDAQWEYAARGPLGRKYPWGNEPYAGRVNFNSQYTTPVNAYPLGATPSGIFDMSGNVYEWIYDWYIVYDKFLEYLHKNPDDPKGPDSGGFRVMRGGSWKSANPDMLLAYFRNYNRPNVANNIIGFRIAENF
ncbi:MAG: SUMF1/EgtB/PvdO family nonheme iron enzyme [candidate division WOR-3 bacterium]